MKKSNAVLMLLLLGLIFVYSCKGDKCDTSEEINSGVIISKIDIFWSCNNTHSAVVRNEQELEDYANLNYCGTASSPELPEVDFNHNSILIYNILEKGCCIFNRDVTIDTITKTVTYSVDHITCKCRGVLAPDVVTVDNNMVLVPKIPDNYEVEFTYD